MSAIDDEVVLTHRPDVPGLRFRRFRGAADYPGMAAANQAGRDAAGILEVVTVTSMAKTYGHLVNCDPATDIVIVERHGTIIGYARVEWRDLTDGARDLRGICLLRPSERGQGIGTALLAWQEARLREIAAGLPEAATRPATLGANSWGADPHATSLLSREGWTPVARSYEMVRPDLDEIPDLALPPDLTIRPVTAADQERIWWAAAEAFRDHRAEPEPDLNDLAAWIDDPRQDPSLWFVAFAGDEIAGSVLGLIDVEENTHHGWARGIVAEVSTRRPWRRQGVARALIVEALRAFRERGLTSAYLGVDGMNPNQAMRLYEGLGFQIASTDTEWSKPL